MKATPEQTLSTEIDLQPLLRNVWLSGLGLLNVVGQGAGQLVDSVARQAKVMLEKGGQLENTVSTTATGIRADVFERADEVLQLLESSIDTGLKTFGFSTRREIDELNARIDKLAEAVEVLQKRS
ncbi:MAG: phasin family protein [Calditrichia bacterium]